MNSTENLNIEIPDTHEGIDMSTWTQKELLRHLYREVTEIKGIVNEMRTDDTTPRRIGRLEERLLKVEVEREQISRSIKVWVSVAGILFTLINLVIGMAEKIMTAP